jgi:hypothetical protein
MSACDHRAIRNPPWNSLRWLSDPGAWYMYFDLLHEYDNIINRLANKVKMLVWSLFLTMVSFEASNRLKLHLHQSSSRMWIFLIQLGYIAIHEVWHVETYETYGDSLLVVQQVAGMFQCLEISLRTCLDACLILLPILPNSKFGIFRGMKIRRSTC